MRKYLLLVALALMTTAAFTQTEDASLNKRLASYLQHTKAMEVKELMEYIHPSLFTILSKEQFMQVFKNTFENKDMVMRIDSIAIEKVSDIFTHEKKDYRKIDYGMVMYLRFTDKSLFENEEMVKVIRQGLEQAFPNGKVAFDELEKSFLISGTSEMMAIREGAAAPWMFLGVERKQPALIRQLFHPGVIRHFGLD